MYDLPVNALRVFAAVYDRGGVRAAARALGIAHSSVSRHLRQLQDRLGIELLENHEDHHRLKFTAQGEALGKAALAHITALQDVVSGLQESKSANDLTVSTTPSFAARWLLPRMAAFNEKYPWIELSLVVDQKSAPPAEQGADISIRMGQGPWEGCECAPLMDDCLYPVVSTGYWEKRGGSGALEDIVGLDLIHDRDPAAAWQVWRREFGPADMDIRKGPRFTSSDLVLRAARQGMGVALARGRLAEDDVSEGLLLRPFGDARVSLPDAYWIIWPGRTARRQSEILFADWLKQEAEKQAEDISRQRQQ